MFIQGPFSDPQFDKHWSPLESDINRPVWCTGKDPQFKFCNLGFISFSLFSSVTVDENELRESH